MTRALAGQVAVVTGASRGIGRAVAVALAERGASVVINYRSDDRAADETLQLVRELGADGVCVQADVGDPDAAEALVGAALGLGSLDLVVNNAGIQRSAMAHRMSDDDWCDVIGTNLSGVFYVCRAALRHMREARAGSIVNVASASSFAAQVGACSYVASKHGLIGLTKALALENAGRGIRINAVAPGLTETDLVGGLSDEQRAGLLERVPLGRLAAPREVAEMVAWVASEATYSTGNVFHASGGVVLG